MFKQLTTQMFANRDEWRTFLLKHDKIMKNCKIAAPNHTFAETLDYIETGLMPQLYWSVSIPFLVLILAIGWLTVVESTSSFRMLKAFAYMFVSAIVIQIIAQTYFIAFFHGKLKVSRTIRLRFSWILVAHSKTAWRTRTSAWKWDTLDCLVRFHRLLHVQLLCHSSYHNACEQFRKDSTRGCKNPDV